MERYKYFKTHRKREALSGRTMDLIGEVEEKEISSLLFIDRSARPISWFFESFWTSSPAFAEKEMPFMNFLNIGKTDFRWNYMRGIGQAEGAPESRFVGIYDEDENIDLFKKRVAADNFQKDKVVEALGVKGIRELTQKNVMIVDEWEFEGVERLFAETMIDTLYKPRKIEYFNWGIPSGVDLPPHGLSYKPDGTYIAKEDESQKEEITRIKEEIKILAKDFSRRAAS